MHETLAKRVLDYMNAIETKSEEKKHLDHSAILSKITSKNNRMVVSVRSEKKYLLRYLRKRSTERTKKDGRMVNRYTLLDHKLQCVIVGNHMLIGTNIKFAEVVKFVCERIAHPEEYCVSYDLETFIDCV